jgi:hypothetical protein
MKLIDRDNYELSTGRTFYANNGLIGLTSVDDPACRVSEGYDGGVDVELWTAAERAELADYMIALWTAFKSAMVVG